MNSPFASIHAALNNGAIRPSEAPWLAWLMVCLCRQRVRQAWLVGVRDTYLNDVDDDNGPVPGLPDWRFDFHGAGLCLMGPNKEAIDVDFHEADGATIDPYFFAGRVLGLDPAPYPEQRLRDWFPGRNLLVRGLRTLADLDLVGHPESTHRFRFRLGLEGIFEAVAAEDFTDATVVARWEAHLGSRGQAEFKQWTYEYVRRPAETYSLIDEVDHVLSGPEIEAVCVAALSGPPGGSTGAALEALLGRAGDHTQVVAAFLARLDPEQHHPYSACAAAHYLLARDVAREAALDTVVAFAKVKKVSGYHGNPMIDRLASLLLEFAPERALPWVRAALRSSTPMAVEAMSAVLAVLDQRWCHRELEAALRHDPRTESHNQRYLVAALAQSQSRDARQQAVALSPPINHASNGVGFTFDEVVAANLPREFVRSMDRARPLAARIRVPDDFGAK